MRSLLGAALSILAMAGRAPAALERFEAVEPHMGTLVRITVYAPGEQAARDAFRAGFDRIRALEAILSDYRPDSELTRVTTTAVGRPVRVSRDLFAVLRASQDLAAATDGAFDITAAPIIRLWREARRTGRVPDAGALADAARRTGFRKMHLDDGRRTVRLEVPGMALDVGANGKGYAASEALAAIGRTGVRSALVAVSGDLAFSAAPPGQRGWRVRVAPEDAAGDDALATLELVDAAVSTAGSSEQFVEVGGRRYSHIIDPATRSGLTDDLTVTVIARHGLEADGLDTAVSVLGVEKGLALVESRAWTAACIAQRTAAGVRVFRSARFLELSATR